MNDQPDVTEMIAVHRAFRDTLSNAPELIGRVDPADGEQVAVMANFYDNILRLLHVHHDSEDVLVFPLLRQRCVGETELIDRVASQHGGLGEVLSTSEETLARWSSGDSEAQGQTAAALSQLGDRLGEHLDQEEQQILPLCAEYLSAQEWKGLAEHGLANFTGDKPWLALGLILERMTPAQREHAMTEIPPPAIEMWANVGEPAYRALMAKVGEIPA